MFTVLVFAASAALNAAAATAAPEVETVGSPVRTATAIRFDARLDPGGAAAQYRFEYGTDGPCATNPCKSSPPVAAGHGDDLELVSQWVAGLSPTTTYHYRAVAENGGGSVFGADMTSTTLSGAALDHGEGPAPPGSDRGWEQVNMDDTGGNPILAAAGIASSGDRVVYQVFGGTPESESGSAFNMVLAERTPDGWQTRALLPTRREEPNIWTDPFATDDLSLATGIATVFGGTGFHVWRMPLGGTPTELGEFDEATYNHVALVSDDGRRILIGLDGSVDPAWPVPGGYENIYELGHGTPRMVGLLPDGSPPSCGVGDGFAHHFFIGNEWREPHWLTPDGSTLVFPSRGDAADCGSAPMRLFVRDLRAGQTVAVPATPLAGAACEEQFLKGTPGAIFFWTASQLTPLDDPAPGCGGQVDGDVYRLDLASAALTCVTCVAPGIAANVPSEGPPGSNALVGVAADGSRVYFLSASNLVPGAPPGEDAYRVKVSSGDLKLVGKVEAGVGGDVATGGALTRDGSVLVFRSGSAWLNPRGGTNNGGLMQYYRYDDRDGSLVCLSCPPDGASPVGAVRGGAFGGIVTSLELQGPNLTAVTADGDVAFDTPTPLVPEDTNTAAGAEDPSVGSDVYEWRQGRLLLVSDGETRWPSAESIPELQGVTPDGHDILFTEWHPLTPDALDAFRRLYDARVGGGFEFEAGVSSCSSVECPPFPPAPAIPNPASAEFRGHGNLHPRRRCPKGTHKVRRQGRPRCVKKPRPKTQRGRDR
jgi:hypothetical protein